MKKDKKKKNTRIVVIVSSIILVSLIILGVTQAYYSSTVYSPVVNEYTTGILTIEAEGKTDNISLTDALPMDDEDALSEDPYIFTIRNIGNVDYQFDVQLLATSGNNTINPDYIKVRVDEEEPMILSDLDDSKIMEDIVLKAGQTMDIKLWVWLSKNNPSTPNTEIGKTFDCEIVTQGKAIYTTSNNGEGITAAKYITNLYTSAQKSTVTNNSITYNTAPSVHLMNDRLGGTTQSLDGGNIRYYGASDEVNNYVWLGETYTSAYTVRGTYYTYSHYNSVEECLNGRGYEEESEDALMYCGPDRVIPAGSKKLYRIIGVFNNKLKLITNESIGYYSWDTSSQDVNNGYGVNEWSQADLMKLLNPGYTNDSINNSLYWNSSSGNCYNNWRNNYTACSFTNNGLSANVQSMISEETWYLGGHNTSNVYANQIYEYERGNNVVVPGTTCSENNCNDSVPRTTTWQGKVALMYPSDYGYATDLNLCTQTLNSYGNSVCVANNWLHNWDHNWLLTPNSSSARTAWSVYTDGNVNLGYSVSRAGGVRPVLYLKSELTIESGSGTELDPYVIG